MWWIILLWRGKICSQKFVMANKTLLINWSLPTYERSLVLQWFNLLTILSMRGWHILMVSFLLANGTPKYLNDIQPITNHVSCWIILCSSTLPPQKYTLLLEGLAYKPVAAENSLNLRIISFSNVKSPLTNINGSSAKHRLVILSFSHFWT